MICGGWPQVWPLLKIIPSIECLLFLSSAALLKLFEACNNEPKVDHLIWCVLYHLEDKLWVVKAHIFFPKVAIFEQIYDGNLLFDIYLASNTLYVKFELLSL